MMLSLASSRRNSLINLDNRSSWRIDTCPAEVLGSIAEYAGINGLANLLCCGSRLLNQKLARIDGVQFISIDDQLRSYEGWFPTGLSSLKGIKQLKVSFSTGSHPHISSLLRRGQVATLERLEEIDFSFEEALTCWASASHPSPLFHFQRHFPALTSLRLKLPSIKLDHYMGVMAYRDSSVEFSTDFVSSHLSTLPPALRRLSLDFAFESSARKPIDLRCLPSGLEDVLLGVQKSVDLAFVFQLPVLTRLQLPRIETAYYTPDGHTPSSLTELSLPNCEEIFGRAVTPYSPGEHFLSLLPRVTKFDGYWMKRVDWRKAAFWTQLERYKVHCFDDQFTPLGSVAEGSEPPDNLMTRFPAVLSELDLRHVHTSRAPWVAFLKNLAMPPATSFPTTLRKLFLPKIEISPSMLAKLPRSVTELGACWTISAGHLIFKSLWPNLKILHFYKNRAPNMDGVNVPLLQPVSTDAASSNFALFSRHLPNHLEMFIEFGITYRNLEGRWLDTLTAARLDLPSVLDHLMDTRVPAIVASIYDIKTIWTAVRYGSMNVLKWTELKTPDLILAYKGSDYRGTKIRADPSQNLMRTAILYQQLEALKWLQKKKFTFGPTETSFSVPLALGIQTNNVEIVEYLVSNYSMDSIWKKRRKVKKRKPVQKKRSFLSDSFPSNGSGEEYTSDNSDDDYEYVVVVPEETIREALPISVSGVNSDGEMSDSSMGSGSNASMEEEEVEGLGTPLTLALLWRKMNVVSWFLGHNYTALSWKTIFKITLRTGSLRYLAQLSALGIEIPQKRFRLFFAALAQTHSAMVLRMLQWLTQHGLDPKNVSALLPHWENGYYDLEKFGTRNDNLAQWLFRHYAQRHAHLGKNAFLDLCRWLHSWKINIFLPFDGSNGPTTIVEFAANLDPLLSNWLKIVQVDPLHELTYHRDDKVSSLMMNQM